MNDSGDVNSGLELLGRGRSGTVWRCRDSESGEVARKVFGSSGLTKVVQCLFLGAPNPYMWNEDAAACVYLRRVILTDLTRFWFNGLVRVAGARASFWDEEARAYVLDAELIEGRAARLHHPYSTDPVQLRDLVHRVMRPLQSRLEAAGFDGLVWQAGRGNPVALNNFLHETGGDEDGAWVWIDLESGVPALFPLNPIDLITFYLPRSFRFRRPLFDDVDQSKLVGYLEKDRAEIDRVLGAGSCDALLGHAESLAASQDRWRSMRRVSRSIAYGLKKGKITDEQAGWYERHWLLWYLRLGCRAAGAGVKKAGRVVGKIGSRLAAVQYGALLRHSWHFLISQRYRSEVARGQLNRRIDWWHERGHLNTDHAGQLREHVDQEQAGSFITDFFVHIAIKPFVKVFQYVGVPSLVALGVLNVSTSALILVAAGAAGRTAYTGGRLLQAIWRGEERPWVALFVGVLPIVGNMAYPVQVIHSSTARDHQLAQFVVYDTFTAIGQFLPIWGGCDTLIEHFFNRVPTVLLARRDWHHPTRV